MRIHVATICTRPQCLQTRRLFLDFARADAVGEHVCEPDPALADAVVFVDGHLHKDDPFMVDLRRHPLAVRAGHKVFVYDERDVPFFSFPGIYVSGTSRWARRYHGAIVGGPYVREGMDAGSGGVVPDLLFSFRGARTHPLRDRVLTLEHPRAVIEDAGEVFSRERDRYVELLRRSKFVLCPRGFGASSIRIFETLGVGRVPVVLGDDWLRPPRFDWDRAVVALAERDVGRVGEILEREEARWPEFVANGSQIAAALRRDQLWHYVATCLAGIRRRAAGIPWWADRRVVRELAHRASARVRQSEPVQRLSGE